MSGVLTCGLAIWGLPFVEEEGFERLLAGGPDAVAPAGAEDAEQPAPAAQEA